MSINVRGRLGALLAWFRADEKRWWGPQEIASIFAGILLALLIVSITGQSLTTFQRDVPLARLNQQIQLDVLEGQIGVFEVLGRDEQATAQGDVYSHLDRAVSDCSALLSGRGGSKGPLVALTDPDRRETAEALCQDLRDYSAMTRTLLENPRANGEGTAFDERLDGLFTQIIGETEELSDGLDRAITDDSDDLRRLGVGMATVVFLLTFGVAFLGSRHRRLLAEQTQQLANFASLVRSSGDGILALSIEGEITSWNAGAESLFGYWEEEIIGAQAWFLVPPEDRGAFSDVWLPVSRGERTTNYEGTFVRNGGSRLPAALTLSPLFEGDTVVGVSVICRDMTERTARDVELANARNAALESSRLKSQFLATMSHEIRTPMNGVLGLNALLLQTSLNDMQRQYAEGVDTAGVALLTVINDILDFSKLEAGKVEFDILGFDPRGLVEEVAGLLAVPAHTKRLELLAYCSPEVPIGLAGDAGRIRQVLLNLAGNAVKFTATGEVLIKVDLVDRDDELALLRFEVRDTGIGIADKGRHSLFESFSQADASTTRRFGGTGLGLAICQRLVDAMGGTIGVESDLGHGSTFWFELPLPVSVAGEDPRPELTPGVLPGLRVLVVDDNATNRLILEAQLTAWRMIPEAVEDAPTALSRLRLAAADGQPYDIAVLDLLMPDMDGLELARRKSADPALDHTRLIMLTSSAYVDGQELADAGITQWCTKPVRTSTLYDRLMRLMAVGKQLTPSPVSAAGATSPAESRGRILVAEDNEINQMVAEGIVSMLGFEVEIVPNGAEALAALASRSYAAVLMDCHMPVMDGFEATRRIRASEADGSHVPIIAMTAGALSEDRDLCLAAGMDGYLSKPVTIEALDTALMRWAAEHV